MLFRMIMLGDLAYYEVISPVLIFVTQGILWSLIHSPALGMPIVVL